MSMPAPGRVRTAAAALAQDDGPAAAAFELKGTVSSLTVVRLRTIDVARIEAELAERVAPFPQIFLNAPVVIDAGLLDGQGLPWAELSRALRAVALVPVGAANVSAAELERAVAQGFGVVQLGSRLRAVAPEAAADEAAARTEPGEQAPDQLVVVETAPAEATVAPAAPAPERLVTTVIREPLVIDKVLRGGQVVYARGVDLVARAPVNAGAQAIADGNIYIWGPLRGRALAGAQGRKDARIFCLALEAELLSVAGEYVLADEIPDALRGKPAQVYLDCDRVKIVAL